MGLFNKLMKGTYKIFCKCPNCGFGSEVKIPRGISVADFVKGGSCKCDRCFVTFFPDEYTTEHFEKQKNNSINRFVKPVAKSNENYKKLKDYQKIGEAQEQYKEGIKWF